MARSVHRAVSMFALLCVSSTLVAAQSRISLTLEKAVEIGLEESRMLRSSRASVQAADARSSEVNASRLPSLRFAGSYTRLSDVPPFEIGPPVLANPVIISPVFRNNYNLRLSLQQPLFTGFKLSSAAAVADLTAQATNQYYLHDRAELIYAIQNAYWNLYKAIEFRKVADENVEQTRAHAKDIRNMLARGVATTNDVLKVEVTLSNAQLLQIDAGNGVRLATFALNNLLKQPLETDIEPVSDVRPEPHEYGDEQALVGRALEDRPEVRAMDLRLRASEANVAVARSGWFPQVYLTGNYVYARPNPRIFPAQDRFNDTWDVGVAVSLDVWNWGSTMHQTGQAEAELEQARLALAELRDAIALEVNQAILALRHSEERIGVAGAAVQQAEENYRVTHEKFKSGLALNSDLLDAEAALAQAKWNHIQTMVDRTLADARLQKAIGTNASLPR